MDDALKHCAELKALFRRQTGGWMDPERLSRVNELCTRGAACVEDLHTRSELTRIALYAQQLYARPAWAGDVLRERILLSIDSIEDHLHSGPA
jgi:hypothetical protein